MNGVIVTLKSFSSSALSTGISMERFFMPIGKCSFALTPEKSSPVFAESSLVVIITVTRSFILPSLVTSTTALPFSPYISVLVMLTLTSSLSSSSAMLTFEMQKSSWIATSSDGSFSITISMQSPSAFSEYFGVIFKNLAVSSASKCTLKVCPGYSSEIRRASDFSVMPSGII